MVAKPCGIATRHSAHQPIKSPEGVWSTRAIRVDTNASLEFTKGIISLPSETTINPSGCKAKFIQSALQFGDIVADHEMTGYECEHSVTELPACLIQSGKGFRPNDSVNSDTALLLKSANGLIEVVVKKITLWLDVPAQVGQPGTHFRDGRSGVAVTQDHSGRALPYR